MNLLDLLVKIGVKDEASEAVEGVSQNIIGKLGKAAVTAAKALAGAFAVKKVIDFGKAAFDAYGQFEQLAGGAEKIFDEVDQSKILSDASGAWKNLNMSANEYLAAINQTGAMFAQTMGDEAGYETAKQGMQAISDYASGTGRNINELNEKFSMITRSTSSYQSIADQFAGILPATSKDFLEQAQAAGLLSDKYKKLTDVPVAEYQQAVSGMLEKGVADLGLAGNTARESLGTITGSIAATKSAWQNLVTEFGKPDADIGARISDMFTALMGENGDGGLVRNVVNEVGAIATNIVNAISSAISTGIGYISSNGPALVSKAMDAIGSALDSAISGLSSFAENFDLVGAIFGEGGAGDKLSKVGEFVGQIGDTIVQKWPEIQEKLGQLWDTLVTTFETVMPQVMEVAGRLVTMAGDAIVEHGPELLGKLGEVVGQAIGGIASFVGDMVQKGHEFMAGLISGTSEEGEALHGWFKEFFPDGLLKGLGDFGKFLLDCGKELIQGLLDGISKAAPDVGNAIKTAFDSVIGFFQGVADFIKDPVGSIEDLVASLTGTSDEAAASVDSAMDDVGTSTAGAAAQIAEYNATELESKTASADVSGNAQDGKAKADIENTSKSVKSMSGKNVKATVSGNAQDGKAKTNIENTNKAVKNLSGKSITVSAVGNIISGVAKSAIEGVKSLISNLHDKTVTLTTHKKEVKDGGAWGGITPRYHATGGVRIADRWGEGVPLDVVGERGPEAIVPLTSRYGKDFAQMMGREAGKYLSGYMGGGNSYNLYYSGEQSALDMFDDLTFRMQVLEAMGD